MNSMKKINAYMQLLLLSVVLLSISCTGDFENMNRNPNEVTDGQMDALNYKIGTKFQSLQGLVVPVQEHMYQFNESLSGGPFGGYIGATVDSWLTKFETFNPSADWRKWPFANVITGLTRRGAASSPVRTTRWPSLSPNCCAWRSCTA